MPSPLIFKLRVISPRSKDASVRNRSHLFYIGKRIGVELNSAMAHGLFGKALSDKCQEVDNIKEVADYISSKTDEGTIMYRAIVSFYEKDAIRLGYDQRSEWENLIKQNIFSIAEKVGVPASRVEYVCAVHMDKGHPHCHFMFWDKEQGVKKPFVSPAITNKIRIDLTKKVYEDELTALHLVKNEARDVLVGGANSFFKDFFTDFNSMTTDEYLKVIEEMKIDSINATGSMMNNRISPFVLEEFALKIFDLKERLPKKGRLNYGFLPAEMKSELEDIVTELIATNEDFSREFERYVNANEVMASYYSSNPDKLATARQKAEDEIIKKLCNKLLENIKKIDTTQYSNSNKHFQKAFRRTEALKLLKNLFSFISRNAESQKYQMQGKRAELSKQAKKELAMKMEHASSIDWERD